ncbi:MAG: hypothetical protein WC848_01425 [Parcubacteria group bacterium]|jgi:hypothetical protein
MNNTKKTIIGLGALAIILGGAVAFANSSQAYEGDPNVKGPNYSEERHEAMLEAFKNNDYNAWKSLMAGRGRAMQVVNESNFARFAEAHRLAESGDLAGAQKIRAELGLGLKNGTGAGRGMGNCQNR